MSRLKSDLLLSKIFYLASFNFLHLSLHIFELAILKAHYGLQKTKKARVTVRSVFSKIYVNLENNNSVMQSNDVYRLGFGCLRYLRVTRLFHNENSILMVPSLSGQVRQIPFFCSREGL